MSNEDGFLRESDQQPVPLLGWLLMGSISAIVALVAGSFMSLIFYWYRGVIGFVLYFAHRDWMSYDGDIAWSLGFLTGVLMAIFGRSRWRRLSPSQLAREKRREQKEEKEKAPGKSVTSWDGVIKRTGWGTLIGVVIGLLVALTLEMMFVSASLSPIGPPSWKKAMIVEMRREDDGFGDKETRMVFKSSHPLFKYLFFVPVCGLTLVGSGIGCVTGLRSWRRQ